MTDQANNTVVSPAEGSTKAGKMKPKILNPKLRQPMSTDEVAKREFQVLSDNLVKAHYTFRLNDKSKDRYSIETDFDFTNCTHAELLQLASVTVRIAMQARLRSMGDAALQHDVLKRINVKADYIDAQRQQTDDTVKTVRLLSRQLGVSEDVARGILADAAKKHAAK